MGSQDDIAEERLLRLIETTGGGKSQAVEAQAVKGVKGVAHSLTHGLQFAFHAWRLNFLSPATAFVREPIRYLTYFFWVVLTGLAIYLISEATHFYYEKAEPQGMPPSEVSVPSPILESMAIVQADEKVRALQAQLDPLRQQNPFTGVTQQQVLVEEAPAEPAKPALSQLIEGLTLVGINRGAGPEAFIEDKTQSRTYFVKVGQTVRNLKVKSIGTDNSVVLELEGEEITLS